MIPAAGPRADLDARVQAWIGEGVWSRDDGRFEALALELFAFQYEHCEPYRRFCQRDGRTPATVDGWQGIPAVPTGAFKELALRSFPAEDTLQTFHTSGTSAGKPGALHLDTLAVYHASLAESFRRGVLPDLVPGERIPMRVLAPSAADAPHSSLSHMFERALARWGDGHSGWDVASEALDPVATADALEAAAASGDGRVAVCGSAWAFVHLLEGLEARGRHIDLGAGARAMETGGYKGRSRVVSREQLHTWIAERLGIAATRSVNQYGMTELGSQFYDSVLSQPGWPRRKLAPPWTRVRILDPETGREVEAGGAGVISIVDLANTGSVIAVETADLGRRCGDGFDVLGRAEGAEARGCSRAADAMLGAG